MLTPLEIGNRKFTKKAYGYSKTEVDEFLNVINENYELLYKENLANKDKLNMLSNAVKQYKSMEETLQNAILVAQSAGDEVIQNAKKRAENIIKDAENKANQLLSDASHEVTRISYEYEDMKRNVEVFRTRVIALLTSQLDIVKEFNMPEKKSYEDIKPVVSKDKIEVNDFSGTSDVEIGASALEQLERVTKELPKIVQNERGEYVAAENDSVKKEEDA